MSKKILICDDDEDILTVTSLILKKAGYEVASESTVSDPIALVAKHSPDLILMDLWIPEIGGEKAAYILKENEKTASIPVIFFSANANIIEITAKTKAEGYIKKPYTMNDLKTKIKKHLS